MFTDHHPILQQLLATLHPHELLVIDPSTEPLPALTPSRQGGRVTYLSIADDDAPTPDARFDFAIVANSLEHLDKQAAGRLIARLRDLHTQRFVVLVPLGEEWGGHASHWTENDLLAYGMTLMARFEQHGRPLALFHYNLADYKTTPDWLNSRYWAHPERWQP